MELLPEFEPNLSEEEKEIKRRRLLEAQQKALAEAKKRREEEEQKAQRLINEAEKQIEEIEKKIEEQEKSEISIEAENRLNKREQGNKNAEKLKLSTVSTLLETTNRNLDSEEKFEDNKVEEEVTPEDIKEEIFEEIPNEDEDEENLLDLELIPEERETLPEIQQEFANSEEIKTILEEKKEESLGQNPNDLLADENSEVPEDHLVESEEPLQQNQNQELETFNRDIPLKLQENENKEEVNTKFENKDATLLKKSEDSNVTNEKQGEISDENNKLVEKKLMENTIETKENSPGQIKYENNKEVKQESEFKNSLSNSEVGEEKDNKVESEKEFDSNNDKVKETEDSKPETHSEVTEKEKPLEIEKRKNENIANPPEKAKVMPQRVEEYIAPKAKNKEEIKPVETKPERAVEKKEKPETNENPLSKGVSPITSGSASGNKSPNPASSESKESQVEKPKPKINPEKKEKFGWSIFSYILFLVPIVIVILIGYFCYVKNEGGEDCYCDEIRAAIDNVVEIIN